MLTAWDGHLLRLAIDIFVFDTGGIQTEVFGQTCDARAFVGTDEGIFDRRRPAVEYQCGFGDIAGRSGMVSHNKSL